MILVELRKLLGRPRTWISIGLLCLLPTVVALFLAGTGIGPRPGQGPALLSAVLQNGQLYPAAALGLVLPIFLPVAVAVVAGDAIAGEAAAGTLRYLLTRPVGRSRLLLAKLISVIAYTTVAVLAVTLSGYLVGVLVLGRGDVAATTLSVSGTPLTSDRLLLRTGLMVAYIAWSMLGVASVSLFLSTVTDSSLGAALGGLAVLIGSTVLVGLDAADAVHTWLPTRYWLSWIDLFRDPILWHDVQLGVLVQAGWILAMLGMAWAAFTTRDVRS